MVTIDLVAIGDENDILFTEMIFGRGDTLFVFEDKVDDVIDRMLSYLGRVKSMQTFVNGMLRVRDVFHALSFLT